LRISIGNHQELQGGLARPAHPRSQLWTVFVLTFSSRANCGWLASSGIPTLLMRLGGMPLAGAWFDYYY